MFCKDKSANLDRRKQAENGASDSSSLCAEGADIPAVVVGVGMGMEGGMAGVQVLVPEDCIQAALEVLKEFEDQDRRPE